MTGAIGIYAIGLVGALVLSVAIADRVTRRSPVRFAIVLAALATVLLMLGAEHSVLLPVGRFVAGVATGAVLAPGTAWVMDLSQDQPGAGARRATIALSLGFGGGPCIVGLVAQWSPQPEVLPYALHLMISLPAAVLVWNAPVSPVVRTAHGGRRPSQARRVLLSREFLTAVPLPAPWVFGTAATAFAIAPTLVTLTTLPVATAAVVNGVTLGSGIGIQGRAKKWEAHSPGRTLRVGMVCAAAGLLAAAALAVTEQVPLLLPVAALLGSAYGLLMVGGLSRVEALAEPEDRARVNAVYYTLTYVGFAAPFVFVILTERYVGPVTLLVAGAVIAVATLLTLPRRQPALDPAADARTLEA